MRFVNAVLCLMFIAFMLVQLNDPDFYLWMAVYAVPAAWTAVACARPARIARPLPAVLLGISLLAAVAATAWFWPAEAAFWQRGVWWESETAREGMGMMIVTAGLLVAAISGFLARGRDTPAPLQGEKSRLST